MISYTDMLSRIDTLDSMYTAETDGARAQLIAKLAALEIGGWLEEFFDEKIVNYVNSRRPECLKEIEERLNQLYAFSYKDIRKMVVLIVGTIKVYDIEQAEEKIKLLLSSSLANIKHERDRAAHISVSESSGLSSPSVLKLEFQKAYENGDKFFSLL